MAEQASTYSTLPKGSLILITGVNGLIASHCADRALQHGYRVRGTTRSVGKNGWIQEVFEKNYGDDVFQLVEVKDMQQPGAFDKAMEGCSAVIHVATVITFDPDPEKVIPPTLAGTQEILKAAAKNPSVKRVVYTSSQGALRMSTDTPLTVTQDTWNDLAVELATDPAKYATLPDDFKGLATYCASKVLAEKSCFEFIAKEKPHFTLNSVVPNFNFGPTIHPTQPASSSGGTKAAFLGNEKAYAMMKQLFMPMNFIDVRDDGRLHLAAAIFGDVQGERIWGMAGDFNFNDVVDVFEKVDPEKWKGAERLEENRDMTVYDRSRSLELLKRLGRDGFVGFEECIRANLSEESSAESNVL